MADTENVPPTSSSARQKPVVKSVKSKSVPSDRKKLQTLQPSGKNQKLLVGADGQLRLSANKDPIKIFEDPQAASTPEKLSKAEREVQATVQTKEQTSQVEEADTAQARAEQVMYGEEDDLPAEYWKELAEKRREALEASLIENEELHTSLGLVEDEKAALKEENDELRACNNTLRLDLERFNGVDIQLQVEKQKTEEMNSVIKMKNDQLRQLLDEYDNVQHQLEIEVAAHMSCQQELEKIQWDKDNFLIENEKRWKELENQKKSGLILDVVRKEKAVAYSFNC